MWFRKRLVANERRVSDNGIESWLISLLPPREKIGIMDNFLGRLSEFGAETFSGCFCFMGDNFDAT